MNSLLAFSNDAFDLVWRTSLSAAILAVLVFLAQKLLGRWLTARWRYTLSLLILIRLLLPVVPSSPLSLENLVRPSPTHSAVSFVTQVPAANQVAPARRVAPSFHPLPSGAIPVTPVASHQDSRPPAHVMSLREIIGLAWAAGCLCLGALGCWRYRRWSRLIGRERVINDQHLLELLDEARMIMGVRRPVTLVAMPGLNSPAVFGLRHVRLLLPQSATSQLSQRELRLIFLHEMAHVRRHDLELNLLLIVVQFLHWFNPLVWLANQNIRADTELICDGMVVKKLLGAERSNYAQLLLKLIDEFPNSVFPAVIPVIGGRQELKRRLIMIKNHTLGGFKGASITTLVVAALICATFTRAQNVVTAEAEAKSSNSAGSSDAKAGTADQSQDSSQLAKEMIGTWVLIGEPGKTGKAPASGGRYKFFTGSRWCITQADPDNHVVVFHHGGTYRFDGTQYVETVQFANSTTMDRIGRTGHFEVKIEGDTLTDIGLDNSWREVWKRVRAKSGAMSNSQLGRSLVGAWTLANDPTELKFITDSSWCDITVDSKTGVVTFHHGGSCTLKGNRYVERVEYANPGTMDLIGHSFKFDAKVDGDTLNIVGIGNPWTQTWKRFSGDARIANDSARADRRPSQSESFSLDAIKEELPETISPLTTGQLATKEPTSYEFGTGPGKRVWQRMDADTWHEVYPDGFFSVFKVLGHAKAGDTEGTVVAKVAGDFSHTGTPNDGTLQAFIPDKGSDHMHHLFRWTSGGDMQWHDLAEMRNVQ